MNDSIYLRNQKSVINVTKTFKKSSFIWPILSNYEAISSSLLSSLRFSSGIHSDEGPKLNVSSKILLVNTLLIYKTAPIWLFM